jgi:hypothetical protein
MNNKERYFAFAHVGADFVLEHCVSLKVEKAVGTTLPDGMHLTHLHLHKNNGKRSSCAGKIVDQYNALVADKAKHIVLAKFPLCDTGGVLFLKKESMASHPIVSKIMHDVERKVAAAWSWPVGAAAASSKKDAAEPKAKKARVNGEGKKGSEAKKLVVDQKSVLDVLFELGCTKTKFQGEKLVGVAYEISERMLKKYGPTAKFSSENRPFVVSCVRELFCSELMFVCAPLKKSEQPMMQAVANDMLEHLAGKSAKESSEAEKFETNSVTKAFFREQLVKQGIAEPTWILVAKDFLHYLNAGGLGAYRMVCIESFLREMVQEKVIALGEAKRPCRKFIVDTAKLIAFLEKK